jgi:hypothetical protein
VETTLARRVVEYRRPAYGGLSLLLLALAALVLVRHGGGWWQLAAFAVGPDVAVLLGVGRGLAKGQLHPRAVPLYNLLHRFWGPVALAVVVLGAGLSLGWLVGALAWAAHVAIDRAVGYGLRTGDGFQRS